MGVVPRTEATAARHPVAVSKPSALRVLDTFSCVGCHATGLHRAGPFETVAFVERNPRRLAVLARHFPDVPRHDDIRTFAGVKSDIIIGGPPCQQTSVAAAITGKRSGASLWSDMLRVGLSSGVQWFVVEQPPGNAAWEAQVSHDLAGAGFHVARLEFGAGDLGAPYIRRRVFLLACASLPRLALAWSEGPRAVERVKRSAADRGVWNPDQLPADVLADWRSDGLDRRERIEALGDSNPPEMAEVIGHCLARAV